VSASKNALAIATLLRNPEAFMDRTDRRNWPFAKWDFPVLGKNSAEVKGCKQALVGWPGDACVTRAVLEVSGA
jgi:hypothetical protein